MLQKTANVFINYYPLFFKAAGITLLVSLVCVVLGTVLGSFIAFLRLSKNKVLRGISKVYIEILRGTPLLLQLYVFVFGLPALGIQMSKMAAAITALSLNSAAYVAEIIRAGIQSIDKGQTEAARSLGMSGTLTMRKIILPQAIRNILPSLGNEFVMLIKESSLTSTFFLGDLMTVRYKITGISFEVMEPLIIVAIFYFIMTFVLGRVMSMMEKRLSRGN